MGGREGGSVGGREGGWREGGRRKGAWEEGGRVSERREVQRGGGRLQYLKLTIRERTMQELTYRYSLMAIHYMNALCECSIHS